MHLFESLGVILAVVRACLCVRLQNIFVTYLTRTGDHQIQLVAN